MHTQTTTGPKKAPAPKKAATRAPVRHAKPETPKGAKPVETKAPRRGKITAPEAAAQPGERLQAERAPSKPEIVIALMSRPEGATLAQMMTATGWQIHSVRSLVSAGMRKKGITPTQTMEGDPAVRVYRIAAAPECV